MKKRLFVYLIIFIVLQLLKSYLIEDYADYYGEKRIEIALNKGNGISYERLKLQEEYNIYRPILINKIDEVIKDSSIKITAVGTTFNYPQLEHLQMIYGAFWGEEATLDGRNVIVISDQLAIELFGSQKAVGNRIHLQDRVYQVVGVYKKYIRIRDYILDNGCEKIYMPITSAITKENEVQFIVVGGSYLEAMPREEDFEKMGINSGNSTKSHQAEWVQINRSISQIPVVVLWTIFCLLAGGWTRKIIKGKEILTKSLFVFGYLGSCYIFFRLAFRGIYVQASALPQENIFDIAFYWKALKAEWMRHNYFIEKGISNFEKAHYLLKTILHSINLIQSIMLIRILRPLTAWKE